MLELLGDGAVRRSPQLPRGAAGVIKRTVNLTYKLARRIAIAVVGSTVLVLGLLMLVTPGPGIVVIPIGLAILSIEFTWARLWLRRVRRSISEMNSNARAERAADRRDRYTR